MINVYCLLFFIVLQRYEEFRTFANKPPKNHLFRPLFSALIFQINHVLRACASRGPSSWALSSEQAPYEERQRKTKNGTLVRGTLVLFAIFEFAQTIRIIIYNIYIIYNY